jgi:hypothetical protein
MGNHFPLFSQVAVSYLPSRTKRFTFAIYYSWDDGSYQTRLMAQNGNYRFAKLENATLPNVGR